MRRHEVLLAAQKALLGTVADDFVFVDVAWSSTQIRLRIGIKSDDFETADELANEIEGSIEGDFVGVSATSEILGVSESSNYEIYDPFSNGLSARVFSKRSA